MTDRPDLEAMSNDDLFAQIENVGYQVIYNSPNQLTEADREWHANVRAEFDRRVAGYDGPPRTVKVTGGWRPVRIDTHPKDD